jgi:hypothetical protein
MTAIPTVDLAARILELVAVKRNADRAAAACKAPLNQVSPLDRARLAAHRQRRAEASATLLAITARAGGTVQAGSVWIYCTADGLDTAIDDPSGHWWPVGDGDHLARVQRDAASGAAAYWRRQRAEGAAK